jgi:hypothetical protein
MEFILRLGRYSECMGCETRSLILDIPVDPSLFSVFFCALPSKEKG